MKQLISLGQDSLKLCIATFIIILVMQGHKTQLCILLIPTFFWLYEDKNKYDIEHAFGPVISFSFLFIFSRYQIFSFNFPQLLKVSLRCFDVCFPTSVCNALHAFINIECVKLEPECDTGKAGVLFQENFNTLPYF